MLEDKIIGLEQVPDKNLTWQQKRYFKHHRLSQILISKVITLEELLALDINSTQLSDLKNSSILELITSQVISLKQFLQLDEQQLKILGIHRITTEIKYGALNIQDILDVEIDSMHVSYLYNEDILNLILQK